jgi:dolichol-phosphate mannosyltransferase
MSAILELFSHLSVRRFYLFLLVGLSGVAVHLLALWLFFKQWEMVFWLAQLAAILVAMTSNFLLNNLITYRDYCLQGSEIVQGLFSFYMACSLGALISVVVASYVFAMAVPWMLAGFLGAVAGSIWNYVATSLVTWKITTKAQS